MTESHCIDCDKPFENVAPKYRCDPCWAKSYAEYQIYRDRPRPKKKGPLEEPKTKRQMELGYQ